MKKQYMKTPLKVSIKVQRFIETLSRMSINQYGISTEIPYFLGQKSYFSVMLEMSPLSVFFWERIIFA